MNPSVLAALVLVLGGCSNSTGDDSSPTEAADGAPTGSLADSVDTDGGWPGGEFAAHVESVPEETPQPERFGMLVQLRDATIGDSELVKVYFDLTDAQCDDGRPATVDDLAAGTAITFSSDPNPAGLDAMYPPPIGATWVSADCS